MPWVRSGSIEGTRPATSSAPASVTTTTKVSSRHESRPGACAHGRANHIDAAVALVRFPRNGPAMPALLAPPAAHHTSGLDGSTRGRSTKPYLIGPAATRWRQSTKGASCERQALDGIARWRSPTPKTGLALYRGPICQGRLPGSGISAMSAPSAGVCQPPSRHHLVRIRRPLRPRRRILLELRHQHLDRLLELRIMPRNYLGR